ncbi:hypothetical protein F441_13085 [Phytophthora nicotianae CJ01A1]|uniref:ABC transporter domain-containing protein n=1 Tax=Phytophthora nicotianae CJ01A1 TaxID=1317063 RepID=W2WPA8_PHYNI|nr:hypothetical protein F441_13085 [Phytophthora nicotianae CJ01A1]
MEGRTTSTANADKPKQLSYDSGASMMAHGPHELHYHMATKIEAALGHTMPQMDIRFKHLSLSADIVVVDDNSSKHELPTIPNDLKKMFVGPKKRTVRKEILKDISGVFKPGKITLLLGQPGSGKSALMKMLSGRFPIEKNITVEGDVTFNNVPREEVIETLPQLVSYVNQRDKHFPTLTVKETLEFAHKFSGGEFIRRGEELLSKGSEKENLEALEATKAYFNHYPEIVIQQLGLQNCQDTIVGDAMLRGVSGGERKRVTTGEMEFGMKYVSLMDEISTGLDSAATYDIINTQRSVAHTLHKNVVIALLQPSPEVFSLFDDVMILNEGELMYHGPCNQVQEYFERLGFSCPPERDIADYLLDLGTAEQHREEVAAIIGVLVNSVFILFMGFSPPAYAIPSGYKWLYTISPMKFPLSVTIYENVGSTLDYQPMANHTANVGHITVKEYTEEYFGMEHDTIARNFGVVIGCIVVFRILGLLALRFVNHQKR